MDYSSEPNIITGALVRERQECGDGKREKEQTSHRMWSVLKARNKFSLSHQKEYSSVCTLISAP